MPSDFELRILDLHWITGTDDPDDLCAHGHPYVRIGTEIVADATTLDVTLSTTALYLLRSLAADYKPDRYASQLLPCCGHWWILGEEYGPQVLIMGCANGLDWTITHTAGQRVTHRTAAGQEATIDGKAYRQMVLAFADQVEQFYASSQPKILPEDADDRLAYQAFWQEWRALRTQWG